MPQRYVGRGKSIVDKTAPIVDNAQRRLHRSYCGWLSVSYNTGAGDTPIGWSSRADYLLAKPTKHRKPSQNTGNNKSANACDQAARPRESTSAMLERDGTFARRSVRAHRRQKEIIGGRELASLSLAMTASRSAAHLHCRLVATPSIRAQPAADTQDERKPWRVPGVSTPRVGTVPLTTRKTLELFASGPANSARIESAPSAFEFQSG
jgi:hypothetical protein